jgi:hypothetical protein
LPLRDRTLSDETLGKMVAGRLKNGTPEEQRAVKAYIRGFLKK